MLFGFGEKGELFGFGEKGGALARTAFSSMIFGEGTLDMMERAWVVERGLYRLVPYSSR